MRFCGGSVSRPSRRSITRPEMLRRSSPVETSADYRVHRRCTQPAQVVLHKSVGTPGAAINLS
jgi:hypothetical protein